MHCTGNRNSCLCLKHSNLRSFYSDGPTDAYGKTHDSTGRKYVFLDPRTLASEREKQEIRTYGISLKADLK